jgi:hypothetical protein
MASRHSLATREKAAWLVRYELWMLQKSCEACPPDARRLAKNPAPFATAMCLTCARNILDFLYPKSAGRTLPKDIIADEFTGGRWPELRPSSEELHLGGLPLGEVRRRLNVEIAHLSYDRLEVRERDDQIWRYTALIANDLLEIAACFLAALREPERSWFGPIRNGDRPWLIMSMLPADASSNIAEG